MLFDFIKINKSSSVPAYRQLHDQLRTAIDEGVLKSGSKVLSIRVASKELLLSRMTVETAYQQLCMEGYLYSRPQKGYFVAEQVHRSENQKEEENKKILPIKYDFSSRGIDVNHADLQIWQKYMRAVLSEEYIMTSYGEPQGETVLREALAAYAYEARGVYTSPSQIVIGAGIQPLLMLLCGLLPISDTFKVGVESPGFAQAEQIFTDFGITVKHLEESHKNIPEDVSLYVYLASRIGEEGLQNETAKRGYLIRWLREKENRYILEDDYNGELRFMGRPFPALHSMDHQVIFLGSFSKLLLPSIRIAYMVLPPSLAEHFQHKLAYYNQSAGKVEQLALAEYIRQGKLEKHLRRLRRLYAKKSQLLAEVLQKYFSDSIQLELWETELRFLLTLPTAKTSEELAAAAEQAGVRVNAVPADSSLQTKVMISFAGIPLEEIESGIQKLAKCWKSLL